MINEKLTDNKDFSESDVDLWRVSERVERRFPFIEQQVGEQQGKSHDLYIVRGYLSEKLF